MLEINIIPSSAWGQNLRSLVPEKWDSIRKSVYQSASYRCEICGASGMNQGYRWPVECHEKWDFSTPGIQKLVGLIALCPMCHKCQHPGLARIKGEFADCVRHFMTVNELDETAALDAFSHAFLVYGQQSQIEWTLDVSILSQIGIPSKELEE